MPRHLSGIVWLTAKVCGLLAGLAACAPPHAYHAARLDSVPMPPSVLMARADEPDCRLAVEKAVSSAPAKQTVSKASETKRVAADAAGADFENETAGENTERSEPADAGTAVSPEAVEPQENAEAAPDPRETELERLKQERDCYKRAEQLARQRLNALQTSSAETIAALNQMRNGRTGPGHRTAW